MYSFRCILVLLVVTVGNGVYAHNDNGTTADSREKRSVIENLPGQVPLLFEWPDFTAIPQNKFMTGTKNKHVLRAKGTSIEWISKVIDNTWLPVDANELSDNIVLIKDNHGPIDAAYVEWEKNGFRFRVSQSKTVFTLNITAIDNKEVITGETSEEKIASASYLCKQVIRNISKIERATGNKEKINIVPNGTQSVLLAKSFNQGKAKICDDGMLVRAVKVDWNDIKDRSHHGYWWRLMNWFTDDHSLNFFTLKTEGGRWMANYSSSLDNTWFEGRD